jgi:hypothetical protein
MALWRTVIDVVNFVLRQNKIGDCTPQQLTHLKLAAAQVAGTMIEDTSIQAARLALEVRTPPHPLLPQCVCVCVCGMYAHRQTLRERDTQTCICNHVHVLLYVEPCVTLCS